MTNRGWTSLITAVVIGIGATTFVDAQKGGKPKPPSDLAATATLTCPTPGTCGVLGDPSPARLLTSTGEMNITLDGTSTVTLDFQGAMGAPNDVTDCADGLSGCLWKADFQQGDQLFDFTSGFSMQTNTLDPSGEIEVSNGLLGIPAGSTEVHRARLNMTINVPNSDRFWRFDFNPNIPPNGGAGLVNVVRIDACTWRISPGGADRASLSILVKPPKGKQYAHRDGLFSMPFELTFQVPSLCTP